MEKISKYLNILIIVMFIITGVFLGMLMWGGNLPNMQYDTPVYMDQIMWWTYALLGLSVAVAIVFPLYQLFTNPKQAVRTLILAAGAAIIVFIAYSLADGTIMNIPGYTGPDNNPETLKFTDMIIYVMYIASIAALGSILVTEIIRKVR